jgi:integrase
MARKIRVEPIRRRKDIKAIKKLLANDPRQLALFTLGINSGLRMGDLLEIEVGQVKHLKVGDEFWIHENKTKKYNVAMKINQEIRKALDQSFEHYPDLPDDSFLFPSPKLIKRPLSIAQANRWVAEWCDSINLDGRYGCHTLRKTWGYYQRAHVGTSWEVITKRFKHRNPAVTREYLGITDEEVADALMVDI